MKREIKFRVWDEGKMYYPKRIEFGMKYTSAVIERSSGKILTETEHNDIVISDENWGTHIVDNSGVQQFTGLTDCNKKEIYEGDIVLIYTWDSKKEKIVVGWDGYGHLNVYTEFGPPEIVGNIFENPELIN